MLNAEMILLCRSCKCVAVDLLGGRSSLFTSAVKDSFKTQAKKPKILNKMMFGQNRARKRQYVADDLPKLPSVSAMASVKIQGKDSIKRITVLNKLFMLNITDLMANGEMSHEILGYGLQVPRVNVTPDFAGVNVFWFCHNSEHDEVVAKKLASIAGPIRHELSQLRLMGEVPRITFVKDKKHGKVAQLDALMKQADFGEDFTPSDPTMKLKTALELEMNLPQNVKSEIEELEECEPEEEELLPEMRNDVLGLDHSKILNKILGSLKKSKTAWQNYEQNVAQDVGAVTQPPISLNAIQSRLQSLYDVETQEKFKQFIERRQLMKQTSLKKKNKQLQVNVGIDDDANEEDEQSFSDGDDCVEEFEFNEDDRTRF